MKKLSYFVLIPFLFLCAHSFGQASLGGTSKMGGTANFGTGTGGGGAFTFKSATATMGGGTSVTTFTTSPAINTVGAKLIVVGLSVTGATSVTSIPTDSAGNSWSGACLSPTANPAAGQYTKICYLLNPTTSASHTFTVTISIAERVAMAVMAWSDTGSGPTFDISTTGTSAGNTCVPSSITGSSTELFATAFGDNNVGATSITISSPFTGTLTNTGNIDGGMSYFINTTGAAQSPTWTSTTQNETACQMAGFLP